MATVVAFKGWNSSLTAWNTGTWNGEGVFPSATASVGSVAITGEGEIGVFGVAGTSAIGTVSITANSNLSVTGLAGTMSVGTPTVTNVTNAYVTGVQATGYVSGVQIWQEITPSQDANWTEIAA